MKEGQPAPTAGLALGRLLGRRQNRIGGPQGHGAGERGCRHGKCRGGRPPGCLRFAVPKAGPSVACPKTVLGSFRLCLAMRAERVVPEIRPREARRAMLSDNVADQNRPRSPEPGWGPRRGQRHAQEIPIQPRLKAHTPRALGHPRKLHPPSSIP